MSAPVRLDVFSDYLCPWCYNAAVRLSAVEEEYGDRIRVHWRAFPVIPDEKPGRFATDKTQEGRRRVAAEEPRARFAPPAVGTGLPASSMPALTAAKCAERQSDAAFRRLHDGLFLAHFRDNLDIAQPDVLWRLAREMADIGALRAGLRRGDAYQAAPHRLREGTAWFGVSAVPAVIFNEKVSSWRRARRALPRDPRLDPRRRARRPGADPADDAGPAPRNPMRSKEDL